MVLCSAPCLVLLLSQLAFLHVGSLHTSSSQLQEKMRLEKEKEWEIYFDTEGKAAPMIGGSLKEHRLRYGWLPCSCQDYTCGCCMRLNVNAFNFTRSACTNFTYMPLDFAIQMDVLMNDESVYKRNVSAKNPPPACMEIPINYLPKMQFCVKLFDIYTPGRNLHMCMDFETRIERAPILILQFDCLVMGSDGLSHQKPTETPGAPGGGGGGGAEAASRGEAHNNFTILLPHSDGTKENLSNFSKNNTSRDKNVNNSSIIVEVNSYTTDKPKPTSGPLIFVTIPKDDPDLPEESQSSTESQRPT